MVAAGWLPPVAFAGSARSHIDDISARFVAAFNAGDGATPGAGLCSEDAALFPPGGDRVSGRAAIRTIRQGAMDSGLALDEWRTVGVDARGELATQVGGLVPSRLH